MPEPHSETRQVTERHTAAVQDLFYRIEMAEIGARTLGTCFHSRYRHPKASGCRWWVLCGSVRARLLRRADPVTGAVR